MNYAKPPLPIENQADLLISRGLVANRDELIGRLKALNYYRLSGYLYPFRAIGPAGERTDFFVPGTTLKLVWRRYNFDRRLRIILFDAIERIEVAVRTRLVYHFVLAHGPFGHLAPDHLPGFSKSSDMPGIWEIAKAFLCFKGRPLLPHERWLAKLHAEKNRAVNAKNNFVVHFTDKYGDRHSHLPLWMACELMTCDTALAFANAMDRSLVKKVGADFGFPDDQLLSWTKGIFTLRNACAHHARIWNRVGGATPCVPGNKNKNPNWYVQPRFAPDRIGHVLTVCHFWLGKVSSTSQWKARLFGLFDEYPEIPLAEMGIPTTWRTHPLWT
ncbi:MAG: Abi family protein [Verrucomicrobia bacterium]|nr:Abi family protein [Verrucomicrobiota bacterium]